MCLYCTVSCCDLQVQIRLQSIAAAAVAVDMQCRCSDCDNATRSSMSAGARACRQRMRVADHAVLLCSEDRLVVVLALLKSGAMKGRGCMFVGHAQGAHRLRMFLDNFGVRAALCHDAMPVNAREHAVEVQPCLMAGVCACVELHSAFMVALGTLVKLTCMPA